MDAKHKAFLEFLREQEREAQAAYFKRVNDFIEMAESLEKNAPVATNDFLEKELEHHLLGKQTSVDPDRLIRGFEMMNKYGREEGLKRLERNDPKLAEQVKRRGFVRWRSVMRRSYASCPVNTRKTECYRNKQ